MEKTLFTRKIFFIIVILFLSAIVIIFTSYIRNINSVPVSSYIINKTYPHDRTAFTQGLIYLDGFFYESTGLYGESDIRKVDPETGEVLKKKELPDHLFGEGLTYLNDRLYQLTWREGVGMVYDSETLELLKTFPVNGEGWGLTSDGEYLIRSDGSDRLYFMGPDTLSDDFWIPVSDEDGPVENINELQYVDGLIYANIWKTYRIAVIDPVDGSVVFWIDCNGIIDKESYPWIDVMNGIAYDHEEGRLFVTGKLWPYLYEIDIIKP